MPLSNWLLETAAQVQAGAAVLFEGPLPAVALLTLLTLAVALLAARRGCW